ncbi:twitchin-like [Amphiura filiformis]|uniref:twitchin-like n=1 Tax=Amphiura filiformis TaxID=82378 RepID=UPI003B2289B2
MASFISKLLGKDKPSAPGQPTYKHTGDSSVKITWSAPGSDGGSPITGYILQQEKFLNGKWEKLQDFEVTETIYDIHRLEVGAHQFQVSAKNVNGISEPSLPLRLTHDKPDVPRQPALKYTGDTSVQITWSAPENDGGSPITGYTLHHEKYLNGKWEKRRDKELKRNIVDVVGMQAGAQYRFQISAKNVMGASDPTQPSLSVTTQLTHITRSSTETLIPKPQHRGEQETQPESTTPVSPGKSITEGEVTQPESTTTVVNPAKATTEEEVIELKSVSPDESNTYTEEVIKPESNTSVSSAESTTEEEVIQTELTTPASPAEPTREHVTEGLPTSASTQDMATGALPPSETDVALPPGETTAAPPEAPGQPSSEYSGDTSVNITWSPPEGDGGSPITGYILQQEMYMDGEWKKQPNIEVTDATFDLCDMQVGAQYRFQVSAKNVRGIGKPSQQSLIVTPRLTHKRLLEDMTRAHCEIDKNGGTLWLSKIKARLEIPEGAINLPKGQTSVKIDISLYREQKNRPQLDNDHMMITPIIRCGPKDTEFNKPITLVLPHSGVTCANLGDIKLWYMSSEGTWKTLPSESKNGSKEVAWLKQIEDKEAIVKVNRFCGYCLSTSGIHKRQMLMFMKPKDIKPSTKKLYITAYAVRDDQSDVITTEKHAGGWVLCAEKRPFKIESTDTKDLTVKITAIDQDSGWKVDDDTGEISHRDLQSGDDCSQCELSFTKLDNRTTDISGRYNAEQDRILFKKQHFNRSLCSVQEDSTLQKEVETCGKETVTDSDINDVACKAKLQHNQLKHLFNELHIGKANIENAERIADTKDFKLQSNEVLQTWRQINGKNATKQSILEALTKCNLIEAKEILLVKWTVTSPDAEKKLEQQTDAKEKPEREIGVEVVTDSDIQNVAYKTELGRDNLKHLFKQLGIKEPDIEKAILKADTKDFQLQSNNVLHYWRQTNGKKATRKAIIKALEECNLNKAKEILLAKWTVTSADKPIAPSAPTVKNIGSKRIEITWSPPTNVNGSTVTGYVIEKMDDKHGHWEKVEHEDTSTKCIVTDVTAGNQYQFRVAAINEGGSSDPSQPSDRITPYDKPSAPSTPRVTNIGNKKIEITWSPPTNNNGSTVTGYVIEKMDGKHGQWEKVEHKDTATRCIVTDVIAGNEYQFRVAAINEGGNSDQSPLSAHITPYDKPNAPSTPTVKNIGSKKIEITWSPAIGNGSPVTGYIVEKLDIEQKQWIKAHDQDTSTKCIITDVTVGNQYQFRVAAINEGGNSDPSQPSHHITPYDKPNAPGTPTVSEISSQTIEITWSPPSDNRSPVTGYIVEKMDVEEKQWNKVQEQDTSTKCIVTNVTAGHKYQFRVLAITERGNSDPSQPSNPIIPHNIWKWKQPKT